MLGVHERTINRMHKDGMPRISHGRYDLAVCVQWNLAQANAKTDQVPAGDTSERKRYDAARARSAELELALREGELVPLADVKRIVQRIVAIVVARLQGLPARAAPIVVTMTSPREIQLAIKGEIDGLRDELAAAIGDLGAAEKRSRRSRGTAKTNG